MTSISATSSSNYQSPLQKLQDELQAEVNSGAISSSDQSALSSALTDINSSLQSGGASDSAGGANSPPGDLKSKIDNLIAGEVSSGKLTSDQATELQGVFKAAFAKWRRQRLRMAAGGPGGGRPAAHHGHHGGHHGGAPPADSSSATDSTTAPVPPTTSCSSFSSRCRIRCPRSSPSYGATGYARHRQHRRRVGRRRCWSTTRPDRQARLVLVGHFDAAIGTGMRLEALVLSLNPEEGDDD